jgi:uncharacterized protein YegL
MPPPPLLYRLAVRATVAALLALHTGLVGVSHAEPLASVELLPYTEYSDPSGLTFLLKVSPAAGVDGLGPGDLAAYWLPPEVKSDFADGSPSDAAPLSEYQAGAYLLPAPEGYYFHVRRVPGEPVRPDSRLVIRFRRPELSALVLSPELPDRYRRKRLDVMLLIDESLSMRKNDKQRLRVAAAKAFIDLAKGGELIGRIGVVAFNHESRLLLPLTPVTEKEKLFAAADAIHTVGETDLDAAIRLGFQELSKTSEADRAAVLLTDGKDEPGVYEDSHKVFGGQNWPVHAIGLSGKADHETLRRIAKDTGGQYHEAPTSGELQRIFGSICFALQRRSLIRSAQAALEGANPVSSQFAVDSSIRNVTFTANTAAAASHALSSPDGRPAKEHAKGGEGGYRYFDVWDPAPGAWRLETRLAPEAAPGRLEVEATAITSLNLWLFPFTGTYEWGEPIRLIAGLALGNQPVPEATVKANIKYPDGSARDVPCSYSKPVYQLIFSEASQAGEYEVRVRAAGTTPKGEPFEREALAHLNIVETKAPRLWLSDYALDFGELYPGETAKKEVKTKLITARAVDGLPLRTEPPELKSQDGRTFPGGALTVRPSPIEVSSRELRSFDILLEVPPTELPGAYQGTLFLQHGLSDPSGKVVSAPVTLSFRARIAEPALRIEPEELDLGVLETGQSLAPKLAIRLEPRGVVPAVFLLEQHSRESERFAGTVELPGGAQPDTALTFKFPEALKLSSQPTELALPLRIGRHASPGPRRWTLRLKAGRFEREVPVRFDLRWPEMSGDGLALDFGRVFCGQTVEQTLKPDFRSMLLEKVQIVPLESQPVKEAHLSGPESVLLSPGRPGEPMAAPVNFALSPPVDGKPGSYEGRIQFKAWFGQFEVPWRAQVDVAKGFVVSRPVVTFPGVQPGTTHEVVLTVLSTIPAEQTLSIRPLLSDLPRGVQIDCGARRLVLGPNGRQGISFRLIAGEEAVPGQAALTCQLRGPYNSASLVVRGEIVPRPMVLLPAPSEPVPEAAEPAEAAAPSFSFYPDVLSFGDVPAGESATSELRLWGNAQAVHAVPSRIPGTGIAFVPETQAFPLSEGKPELLEITCLTEAQSPEGEWWSELVLTSNGQTMLVPVVVRICPGVGQTTAAPGMTAPPKPAVPATPKLVIPQWLRNLAWILLVLLTAAAVAQALKWVFAVTAPEMTKFYLASGVIHVMLAFFGAVYFLESKVIVSEPEMLQVRLTAPQPATDPRRAVQESQPVRSLDQKPIEVRKEETQTMPVHEQVEGTEEKKTTSTSSPDLAAQEVEMEKKTENPAQELAQAPNVQEKRLSASRAQVAGPQLKVSLRKMLKPEKELPETEKAEERDLEDSERERSKAEERPDEREAEDISPEKQEQPTEPAELAQSPALERTLDARSAEDVQTNVQRPEERSRLEDAGETAAAQPIAAERSSSAGRQGKSKAAPGAVPPAPRPVELALASSGKGLEPADAPAGPAGSGDKASASSSPHSARTPEVQAKASSAPASAVPGDAALVAGGRDSGAAAGFARSAASVETGTALTASAVSLPEVESPAAGPAVTATPAAAGEGGKSSSLPSSVSITQPDAGSKLSEPVPLSEPSAALTTLVLPRGEGPSAGPGCGKLRAKPSAQPGAGAGETTLEVNPGAEARTVALAGEFPPGYPGTKALQTPTGPVVAAPDQPAAKRAPGSTASVTEDAPALLPGAGSPGAGPGHAKTATQHSGGFGGPAQGTAAPKMEAELGPALDETGLADSSSRPQMQVARAAEVTYARIPVGTKVAYEKNLDSQLDSPASDAMIYALKSSEEGKRRASRFEFQAGKSLPWSPSVLGPTRETNRDVLLPAVSLYRERTKGSQPHREVEIAAAGAAHPVTARGASRDRLGADLAESAANPLTTLPPGPAGRSRTAASGTASELQASAVVGSVPGLPASAPSIKGVGLGDQSPKGSSAQPAAVRALAVHIPAQVEKRAATLAAPIGEGLTSLAIRPLPVEAGERAESKKIATQAPKLAPADVGLPSGVEPVVALVPTPAAPEPSVRNPNYRPATGQVMTKFTTYLGLYKGSHKAFDDRQIRSMRFLADETDRRLDFILSGEVKILDIGNRGQLLKAPWVFLTGEFPFEFTETEARNLKEFIELGGWLWAEDCGTEADLSFDRCFHQQMKSILPKAEFKALPMDHPIFTSCYDLRKGYLGYDIPPGDKYRENRLHAYFVDERPAVIYTRNDYGCGLEIDTKTFASTRKSLTDLTAAEMQNGSVMMSLDLIFYFLGEQGVQSITTRVTEAARRESDLRAEYEVQYHRLFVQGAILPPFEDFESETAAEWQAIGEDQITETTWTDVDVAKARITGGENRKLELSYPVKKGKTAFERSSDEPVDISGYHGLLVDIDNKSSALVRVAVAFVTMPDWQYFESQPAFIKPGLNRNVLFYLFLKEFKNEGTQWEYRSGIKNPDSVRKIVFLTYAIKPGTLTFDNVRFSRVKADDVRKLIEAPKAPTKSQE